MKKQVIGLIGGLALLLGLVSGVSANLVSYGINMDPGSSNGSDVQDTFIFEWDNSGNFSVDYAYTIAGSGLTTLTHTIDFAPTSAFIIGYGLGITGIGDEKDHLFTLTSSAFLDSMSGTPWSIAFPGVTPETRISHSAMLDLLATAATGDYDALDSLTNFVKTEGYRAAFDPAGRFEVVEWSTSTVTGGSIPEPASLALLGIGLLGMSLSRKRSLKVETA